MIKYQTFTISQQIN